MLRLTRVELLLRILTMLYVALAATALLLPPAQPADAAVPAALREPAPLPEFNDHNITDAGDVVAANIFSSARRAPERRYDPLTFGTEPVPAPAPVVSTAPITAEEDAVPKLYGIVGGPEGAAALLRLDPAAPGALLYRVGERGGAYRVEEINEQSVVLSGPAGRTVLRLVRQES